MNTAPLHKIMPNPSQPRQTFNSASLLELALSIHSNGLIQPIVVEPDKDSNRFILHGGERRWRASCALAIALQQDGSKNGLAPVLKTVIEELAVADPREMVEKYREELSSWAEIEVVEAEPGKNLLVRGLVENVQREDLTILEVAEGYEALRVQGWTHQKIADAVGKSRSHVTNALRLLQLPEEIREPLANGEISERQAQALLPLYQLPEPTQEAARQAPWGNTSVLIKQALGGADSSSLRNDVQHLVNRITRDLGDCPFLDHEFAEDNLQSPQCTNCPARVKRGKSGRCGDDDCYKRKKELWAALRIRLAAEASGIPILDAEESWREANLLSDDNLAKKVVEKGCPKLALRYDPFLGYGQRLPDFPDVRIVCHHGEGQHCRCLAALKREQTKNDPEKQAENEAKKRLESEIIAPAARVLLDAIVENDRGAWRLMLPRLASVYIDHAQDWDLPKIQERIARSLIGDAVPWNGHHNLDISLRKVIERLAQAGLSFPDAPDDLALIERNLERIAGWVATFEEEIPTEAALGGNIRNINDLVDALDEIIEDEDTDEVTRERCETLLASASRSLNIIVDTRHILVDPLLGSNQEERRAKLQEVWSQHK